MIIIRPIATAQTFNIIPRQYVNTFTMVLRDDSTNVIVDYAISDGSIVGNYLNFTNIFSTPLVEAHFYDLTLYSDSLKTNVIYKDRLFCTAQDINQTTNNHYKINEGQFTSYDGYNNDFIVV
jgi:hypothetical protein